MSISERGSSSPALFHFHSTLPSTLLCPIHPTPPPSLPPSIPLSLPPSLHPALPPSLPPPLPHRRGKNRPRMLIFHQAHFEISRLSFCSTRRIINSAGAASQCPVHVCVCVRVRATASPVLCRGLLFGNLAPTPGTSAEKSPARSFSS